MASSALFRRPYGRSPLFGLLADQAGELMGCVEGSAEDAQLHRIRGVLEAYEFEAVAGWKGGVHARLGVHHHEP